MKARDLQPPPSDTPTPSCPPGPSPPYPDRVVKHPRGHSYADLFPPEREAGPQLPSRAQSPQLTPAFIIQPPPSTILCTETGLVSCTDVRFGTGCASQLAMLSAPFFSLPRSITHMCVSLIFMSSVEASRAGRGVPSTSIPGTALPARTQPREPALAAHPGGAELPDPQGWLGLPGSSPGSLRQQESSPEPDVPTAPLHNAWPPQLQVLSPDAAASTLP